VIGLGSGILEKQGRFSDYTLLCGEERHLKRNAALDDLVQETSQAVILGFAALDDFFDHLAIRELGPCSR